MLLPPWRPLLLLALVLSALAPSLGQEKAGDVRVELLCRAGVPFRWRTEGGSWQDTQSNRELLPALGPDGRPLVYDVRVDTPAGLFHRWHFERQGVRAVLYLRSGYTFEPALDLDPLRVAAVAVLPLALAAAYGALQLRRSRVLNRKLAETQEQLSESEARVGIFPVDGSTPPRIDVYDVVGKLGAGGMAVVFQVRRDGHDYAMKLPLPNVLDDDDFRARFVREGLVGSSLHHPHIVHVQDVNDGQGRFGYPYIVMELVNGVSLKDRLRLAAMTSAGIVRIGEQVLDALAYLHGKGIVHRDIKPANVMVTPNGSARLMDFGIAYAEGLASQRLTATGDMLGTPVYLAPEQISMDRQSTDPRIDVYGVGMMLYEALAGRLPWSSTDTVAAVLEKVSKDPVDLGKVCPGLAPPLADVVMRMIARDPAARYPTAAAARDALRTALE